MTKYFVYWVSSDTGCAVLAEDWRTLEELEIDTSCPVVATIHAESIDEAEEQWWDIYDGLADKLPREVQP